MSEKKIVDQRAETLEYMKKHKITKLFDILGSKLAREKPDDPNEFLLTELKKIQELKSIDQPVTLFTEDDIEVMFSIFDLTGRGFVDKAQYIKGRDTRQSRSEYAFGLFYVAIIFSF